MFRKIPCISREHFESFPELPVLRNEFVYEEATFLPGFLAAYRPSRFDITVTCSYPFVNWILSRAGTARSRPPHVFVTENGDWPAVSDSMEFRWFDCDGLVCTNPDYFDRNKARWNCALIPNGIDPARFQAARPDRRSFGLPDDRKIVLMVSALSPSKRVTDAIVALSRIPDCHLVIAGDGPERDKVDETARQLIPDRFTRLTTTPDRMPALYRSADLFLHMSMDEAFGNVFLEALASEKPLVVHDLPRYRWIIGDDGLFVDTLNREALVGAVRAGLDGRAIDRDSRRARIEMFSWHSVATQYEAFFLSLLADKRIEHRGTSD